MLVRQRFLLLVTGVMVAFLITGAYFIARAIRRDIDVSRMQSDFVSAVSHEFRSPLTSIRQLSEILALGRVAQRGRRAGLLRDAGARNRAPAAAGGSAAEFRPHGSGRSPVPLRRAGCRHAGGARVVAEFEPQIAGSGRHIELDGCAERLHHRCRSRSPLRGAAQPGGQRPEILAGCPTVLGRMGRRESQRRHPRAAIAAPAFRPPERRAIFRKNSCAAARRRRATSRVRA